MLAALGGAQTESTGRDAESAPVRDAQNAFKCYVRTRDYCTTPKHIVAMCLAVIKCGIEMNNFAHVNNYVQKAEQTPDVAVCSHPIFIASRL